MGRGKTRWRKHLKNRAGKSHGFFSSKNEFQVETPGENTAMENNPTIRSYQHIKSIPHEPNPDYLS